ncbi:MAG: 5'-3' exonuclease H3TH domain-containing protein [Patescibacteria group bacterium]
MNTILLIDGNAIMHRAYHALPPMSTNEGVPTNAVFGFFTMLQKAVQDLGATHLIVCFDTPKPTFRKELLKEYQAHRPKMVTDMSSQFPLVRQLLDAAGVQRFEKEGFEADDVIGTLAEHFKKQDNFRVFILTGDRDIMQLVDQNVFVITPLKGLSTIGIYNSESVLEKFGVEPKQIPDLKALMGDSSDNYHGAKGIGPKTAVKLLNQFKTVENLLENVDQIKEDRIRGLIQEHVENIRLSKQLATISRDVDVVCEVEQTAFTGFKPQMRTELEKLQLYSLLGRLFGGKSPSKTAAVKESKKEKASKKELFEKTSPQLDLFS